MTALVLFYWLKWILLLLMLYIFFFSTVAILPCSQNLLMYLLVRTGCCSGLIQLHNLHNHRSYICSFDVYELFDEKVTWHRGYCSRFFAMDFNSHIWIHHFGRLTDVSVLDRAQRLTRQEKRILLVKSWSISVFPSNTKQPASRAVSIVYIDLWLFYILTNSLSAVDEMKKDRPCLT